MKRLYLWFYISRSVNIGVYLKGRWSKLCVNIPDRLKSPLDKGSFITIILNYALRSISVLGQRLFITEIYALVGPYGLDNVRRSSISCSQRNMYCSRR